MIKVDYANQFTATRAKKLKVKRTRQKIARHLQAALNIATGDALVLFIGNGDELSNLEALESWVAQHCSEQDLDNISNHLSELTCELEYQLNKLEVY